LSDEHRFSLLILDRAPINEKISLAVGGAKAGSKLSSSSRETSDEDASKSQNRSELYA
jgi:hypothetical protein